MNDGPRRLWALAGGLAVALLLGFLVLAPFMPEVVAQPSWLVSASPLVAIASMGVLAMDVLVPVPSSLVMVANGAVFGLLVGTLVSTVGTTLAAVIGHGIGRSTRYRSRRWLGATATDRLDDLLARHGQAAVVATRPIPIAAEVVAILAGQGGMPLRSFTGAALLGALGTSAVYAAGGALAIAGAGWIPLAVAGGLATVLWLLGRRSAVSAPTPVLSASSDLPAQEPCGEKTPGSSRLIPDLPSHPTEHP